MTVVKDSYNNIETNVHNDNFFLNPFKPCVLGVKDTIW